MISAAQNNADDEHVDGLRIAREISRPGEHDFRRLRSPRFPPWRKEKRNVSAFDVEWSTVTEACMRLSVRRLSPNLVPNHAHPKGQAPSTGFALNPLILTGASFLGALELSRRAGW